MVAGGFAVAGSRMTEINDRIAELRASGGIASEFHWSEYRGGERREAYEDLVRYAFQLIRDKHAALHLIIGKFKGYNHKAKPGENKDTSINRMYFQLCLHKVARFYGPSRAIHIRLDDGNDSSDICKMRNQLCAAAYRQYSTKPNCVRSIEPIRSEKSGIVQMADVIVGAVAAKRNSVTHLSPKGDLADYVLQQSNRRSWDYDSRHDARFLTVWNHKTGG